MSAGRTLRRAGAWLGALVLVLAVGFAGLWARDALAARRVPVTRIEYVPPGEEALILEAVRKATSAVDLPEMRGADGRARRDAHAAPHGCVKAQLTVDDTIPERLRQGVFRTPGRSYEAWVRFSNGTESDDRKPDARGMAIKLMGVEGPKLLSPAEDPEQGTQDFAMVNNPTFFLADLAEYQSFFDFQAAGRPIAYFFQPPTNPLAWKLRELTVGLPMLKQQVASPLRAQYYSMSAYRFGPENIKFSVRPCDPALAERHFLPFQQPKDAKTNPHFLRRALRDELRAAPACFHFLVQLQDPHARMPIEDPSIPWSEAVSPYRQVATLDVPAQTFDTAEQDAFCERLQFAPWHAVVDQRPLGQINRARQMVYREVSRRRHYENEVPLAEPKPGWCLDLSGAACPAAAANPPPAR